MKNDLTQFQKLKDLMGNEICLWIPQQVYDEVFRNREAKINDALKSFEVKECNYPIFCQQYSEFQQFHEDFQNLIQRHKEWRKKIEDDVRYQRLPADETIRLLFRAVDLIPCDSFIEKAYTRYRIGNPPGKDNKYGDAINWECLLSRIPDGEDLYFISADKDYRSTLYEDKFNPFLENEWKEKKKSNIHFYKDLTSFFKEHAKDILLKTETEKTQLIKQLQESGSFMTTHVIIGAMNKYSNWTTEQIEDICLAAEDNTQVKWVLEDDDVFKFYTKLLANITPYDDKDSSIVKVAEQLKSIERDQR